MTIALRREVIRTAHAMANASSMRERAVADHLLALGRLLTALTNQGIEEIVVLPFAASELEAVRGQEKQQ